MSLATEQALLEALAGEPSSSVLWHALADCRQEMGDPAGELLQLHLRVRAEWNSPGREAWQMRMAELLADDVTFGLPTFTNSQGMQFVLVPPGRFLMGSPVTEQGRSPHEQQHVVEITRAFWMGVHHVTVSQFRAFTQASRYRTSAEARGDQATWHSPGIVQEGDHPVVCVSWEDAGVFCNWLTDRDGRQEYQLTTEAEWEYACRAGTPASWPFHFGTSLSSHQANFHGDAPYGSGRKGPYLGRTSPVGAYRPNGFGLHEMHGNVWQWCEDWYSGTYYLESPELDPHGPDEASLSKYASMRAYRGGQWNAGANVCRAAYRYGLDPADSNPYLGFRLAISAGE
jgi:formylglycine-generating enzyme required for sulfatase activity